MSTVDPSTLGRTARVVDERLSPARAAGRTLGRLVLAPVRLAAFWLATFLPFSYLPLLATGVAGEHPFGFVGLLAANALAFVLGHSYKDDRQRAAASPSAE